MIEMKPGMRVRRVRGFYGVFRAGDEDVVTYVTGDLVETAQYPGYLFNQRSFKPVIRVKAKSEPVIASAPSATAKSAMEELERHYRRWYKRSLPDWAINPGADEELERRYRRRQALRALARVGRLQSTE